MFKQSALLLLLFVSFTALSSNKSASYLEDEIVKLIDSIENTSNFTKKNELNNELISLLYDALLLDNSFEYPFSKVQKMQILTSSDERIKVYTW
ncbi:MAG TPA: hypothetical protein DG754_13355, partial [Bacteroidales bacterium]|nr:hypothetical protein [Bacteroidales bacterium]